MIVYRHRCWNIEWIGRQVQIIQARRYDWELPSEPLRHSRFVRVIIESYKLRFGGIQSRKLWAAQLSRPLMAPLHSKSSGSSLAVGLARSRVGPRRIRLNPPNQLKCWRPC